MQILYNHFLYAWYRYPLLFIFLLPFSYLYRVVIYIRRLCYQKGLFNTYRAPIPVIVVGNFVVGGTGKTPMVIAIAQLLKKAGFQPGIITRGYGSQTSKQSFLITKDTDPKIGGDEAVLIAEQTHCPVIKNKNRAEAAKLLVNQADIIISDDGLQHYSLISDIKIAMLADTKWLRNHFCLPAGPWREPKKNLATIDLQLEAKTAIDVIYPLHPNQKERTFKNQTVHAVCAIAAPWRFFSMLNDFGIKTINHAFPDHYLLTEKNLTFPDQLPILITEKDAVKCQQFNLTNVWVVKIKIELTDTLATTLLERINTIKGQS